MQPPGRDRVPAWAVERVHLSAYDSRWPGRAAQYANELRPVLAPWLLGTIEHVGSTAVPGLVAKPVIDLMAQVTDTDAVVDQAAGDARRAGLAVRAAGVRRPSVAAVLGQGVTRMASIAGRTCT